MACSSTISRFDVFARIQSDACREKQGARNPELGTRNYLRIIAGFSRSEERFAVLLKARQQPDYFRVTFLLSKLQRRAATRNTQQSEVSCSFYSDPLIALQASTARSDAGATSRLYRTSMHRSCQREGWWLYPHVHLARPCAEESAANCRVHSRAHQERVDPPPALRITLLSRKKIQKKGMTC